MTPTKTKTEKIMKTQKQKNEKPYLYAARMINTYTKPLTVDMALERNNKRYWKPTRTQMQSALHHATRKGLTTKFRDPHYKRIVYAKLNTTLALDSDGIVAVRLADGIEELMTDIESAPLDEVIEEAKKNHVRTPIVKATGVSSLILDAIAVYHGYGTTGHVEELIMNHIRNARVNNSKLFIALRELFE